MAATIENFTPDAKATDIAETLRHDGAAIIRNVVAPEVMDDLAAKLEPRLSEQEIGGGRFFGHRRRSVAGVFAMEPEFSEHLMLNETVLEVADEFLRPDFPMAASAAPQAAMPCVDEDVDAVAKRFGTPPDPIMGPFCHHYRVNVGQAMQVWGSGKNQPLHREMGTYGPYLQHDPAMPEYILAVNWAVTDFTRDNGATRE